MPKPAAKSTKPTRNENDARLRARATFLLANLGYDPRERMSFRATTMAFTAPLVGSTLAADPAAALAMINASAYVKEPQTEEGIYIHTVEAASTRYIADRFAFLSPRTVANIAADCQHGISFMTRHAVGGAFEGPGENGYGRTFAGQFEQRPDVTRALAQFYMLRSFAPNGANAPSTDDLHRGLMGGTLFDFSTGLTRGGLDLRTCDVCHNEIFSLQCSHCPGTVFGMSDEEIALQAARGVPEGKATFTFDDWHAGELSLVFNGAIPNAGTSFSTGLGPQGQLATGNEGACSCCASDSDCGCSSRDERMGGSNCSCDSSCTQCSGNGCDGSTDMAASHQEEPMFTKELKLSLGLAESATDAEVTAKILANAGQITTLAAHNETLVKAQRDAADAAFSAKWTEKLGADTVASLLGLTNREDVATNFAARLDASAATQQAPAIGNPLLGTGLAAAPNMTRTNTPSPESETFRRAIGKFKTAEEVAKFASIGPIEAMEKWLSTSGTPVTLVREPFHENFERQTKDNRMAMLGLNR